MLAGDRFVSSCCQSENGEVLWMALICPWLSLYSGLLETVLWGMQSRVLLYFSLLNYNNRLQKLSAFWKGARNENLFHVKIIFTPYVVHTLRSRCRHASSQIFSYRVSHAHLNTESFSLSHCCCMSGRWLIVWLWVSIINSCDRVCNTMDSNLTDMQSIFLNPHCMIYT